MYSKEELKKVNTTLMLDIIIGTVSTVFLAGMLLLFLSAYIQ
jgi:preprotein translocase subunit SecF